MTVSRSAGKFAVKILSLFLCVILTTGISLSLLKQDVSADGTVTITSVESWADGANINFKVSGYSSGTTVSFNISCGHSCEINGYNFGNGAGTCSKADDQVIAVSITGWGDDPNNQYQIQVVGTWSDFTASISSVSSNEPTPTPTPTPIPTPTPKPTATPTPKPTATPTPVPANNNAAGGNDSAQNQAVAPAPDSGNAAAPAAGGDAPAETTAAAAETAATTAASETTETTDPTETAETDNTLTAGESQETVMAVVGEVQEGETYDQTVVLDETHEDGSPVVMGLNSKTQEELSVEKAKKELMTASFWIVLLILLAGAGYARYRYLKQKKGYKGSEIAINFIPGTSDLIYAIGYHFNLPGKGKDAAPAEASASHASFNTASAMKELKKMETTVAATKTAQTAPRAKSATPSVPHKRPKELSVNHAAAVAAAKASQEAPKTRSTTPATPSAPHKRPKELSVNHAATVAAAKTSQEAAKPNVTPKTSPAATTGSSLGTEAARAARERAEAAKEQLRMRAEARRSKIEEVKREELQQRPPVKRPASLSVNHAAAAAAAATAKETTARSEADVEPTNSPFKPLDRSAEREIYSTPGLRPRKSAEDHQKMASGANQLGKAVSAQKPEAPYARGGKAPMWAAPGTGRINPFKPSASAETESAPEANPQPSAAQPTKTSEHASIADQTTHRSAFFDRSEKARTFTPAKEERDTKVGDLTRPSGKGKAPHAPTVGMSLEGKDSSILNNGTAPTATKPLPGFKPIDPNK